MGRGVSPTDIPKQGNKNSERLAKKRRLAAEDLVAVHLRIGQGLVWIKLTEKELVSFVDKSEKQKLSFCMNIWDLVLKRIFN